MGLNWSKDRNRRLRSRARQEQYEADRTTARAEEIAFATPAKPAKQSLDRLMKEKFPNAPTTTLYCLCGHSADVPAVTGLRFRCSRCRMKFVT